jgi:hypothetical protein
MFRPVTTLLSLTMLAACGASTSTPPPPLELEIEGSLRAGASATVKGTDIEVTFVAVSEDSRCPRDVACTWAGEVKVKLAARLSTAPPVDREVLEGRSTLIEPYRLTITRVLPEPISTHKTAPDDYRILLVVVKI